jgi:aryl-phospho-beta-D-glucosidase BglC (GH1 family)
MRCVTRVFVVAILAVCAVATVVAQEPTAQHPWLPATPEKLPRWRGFNLLEKFILGWGRKPFLEDDFRLISKLGFNFVRLPMDYRLWIKDGNWEAFDETTLKEIDQAVAWGGKYGIHVSICFHRAPGYTVAQPPERTSLWTDAETQRVCAKHWAMFARRYRGIPSVRLSFNLMNEPAQVEAKAYVAVVRKLVDAIRHEDPDRLIISDGLQWGTVPVLTLRELHIAQATRGYAPMEITHYKASWVHGESFPEPRWPRLLPPNGTLLSPDRPELSRPLVIDGPFPAATELRLRVLTVSAAARLVVEADGQPVFQKQFRCGPGEGEWKKAVYKEEWHVYQNLFDRDYTATIPAGTRRIRVRVTEGDWLEIGQIGLKPTGAKETTLALKQDWGKRPEPFRYAPDGQFVGLAMQDRAWLWKNCIEPWKEAESQGIGIMVGEWGVFNKTPHDLVLRWAEDCLRNWRDAGWGWAMWNFRGAIGVLDSDRADVRYEDFEGHKLDREFLNLLQRY